MIKGYIIDVNTTEKNSEVHEATYMNYSEWLNVHFYIRAKPKAEYLKIFGLWPNTEAKTECWIFRKLLSICSFSLTFANPILIKPYKIF